MISKKNKKTNKRTRKTRKQKGGRFNVHDILNISNIREIIMNPHQYPYEVCGKIDPENPANHIYDRHGSFEVDRSGKSRAYCNQSTTQPIIWHTHMRDSKYFPSLEDIVKVLKYKKIRTSYIYTEYGYWILNNPEDNIDNNIIVIDDQLKRGIQYNLDIFYHNTKEGRSYNRNDIEELNFMLNDIIQSSFPNFNISWSDY
jgi:hypothetical protein